MESGWDSAEEKDQPSLLVIEGDDLASTEAQPVAPERAIVPDAFEQVMARLDAEAPLFEEFPPEPVYKSRALIGVACLIVGVLAGKLTTEPKIVEKIVEKVVPGVSAPAQPEKPILAVANPFRKLASTDEFDPWMPLNGGFPLPPTQTQEQLLSGDSGRFNPGQFSERPPRMTGQVGSGNDIGIFEPGLPPTSGQGSGSTTPLPDATNPNSAKQFPTNKVEKPDKVVARASEQFVLMVISGPEPSSGQSRALGLVGANGGTGRSFTHMTLEGSVESQGVLLIVPIANFEKLKNSLEGLGGASIEGTYAGNAGQHQGKIQGQFVSRLAKLREKKDELLKDFEEGAQPVKQILEAIDAEARAVSSTRLPGGLSGKAVILVEFR